MLKKDIALIALEHTKKMETDYLAEIAYSIHESEIFRDDSSFRDRKPPIENTDFSLPESKLISIDSVRALFLPEVQQAMAEGKRIAILNFASFKNPGGKFLDGSTAQEEMLCHTSYLYNVLESFYNSYYVPNQRNTFQCLYNHSALYCAGVRFWNMDLGDEITEQTPSAIADVITCAAPNKSAAKKYYDITSYQIDAELQQRIYFIRSICQIKQVDLLIAGAWGCGVFGNDPRFVAHHFKGVFETNPIQYPQIVIHPVPMDLSRTNYLAFKSKFPNIIEGTENNEYIEWH